MGNGDAGGTNTCDACISINAVAKNSINDTIKIFFLITSHLKKLQRIKLPKKYTIPEKLITY